MKRFKLVDKFRGYVNQADITNIAPGFLVSPSQNVEINSGEKVSVVPGYSLVGASSSATTPIESSHWWDTSTDTAIHIRSYDDELEFYYSGSWRRLADGFSSVAFQFAEWWDNTEKLDLLLIVNGDSNMRAWSGGITTFASATSNTITKQGTNTWAQDRFLTSGTRQVIIGGITYTYTGGESTTTLTGVTPDPTSGGHAAGDVVHQAIRTTATTPASGFNNDIIAVRENQVWVGDTTKRTVYLSKNTSYTDYTSSSPRLPGEGLSGGITIDSPPVAFVVQEEDMYVAGGKSQWYKVKFTLSDDLVNETFTVKRLKTAPLQGPISQSSVANIKNDVAFVTNELTIDTLGRVTSVNEPQTTPLSNPVQDDFDDFDYTIDPHVKYFDGEIWITIPSSSRLMRYDVLSGFWQPPRVAGFSRLEVGSDGNIYGHSSSGPETYLLNDGTNDNENPIHAIAAFAYRNYGERALKKNHDEHYTEGYIAGNTTITAIYKYDFGGVTTIIEKMIEGSDAGILFETVADGSIGKNPFGSNPLGSVTDSASDLPKFRTIHQLRKNDYYEYQVQYESNDVDYRWELIAQGANAVLSGADNVSIKR